tara:strand:+ start:2471 stop:2857 length:387 start_codon:yes stop_codon:yes gene_type:complete
MNPILLVRLLLSLKDYQKQISKEADKFDQDNNLASTGSRTASKVMIGAKIILTAMVLGDLPIDVFDLGGISQKLGWLGVFCVTGVLIFGFLGLTSIQEMDQKRAKIQTEEKSHSSETRNVKLSAQINL